MRCFFPLSAFILSAFATSCVHRNATNVFYATSHPAYGLHAVPVTGGEPKELLLGQSIDALAFDPRSGHLLSTEPGWAGGIVRRRPDGTPVDKLVENPRARDLAVDHVHGHLYWAAWGYPDSSKGTIERVDLADGENRVSFTGPELRYITSLTLDLRRGKLYWTGGHDQGRLWRSDLDGTHREHIGPNFSTRHVAIDPIGGRLYFDEIGVGSRGIWWSRLDGSDAEPLIFLCGGSVSDLHVDSAGRKLYWTEPDVQNQTPRIRRSNLRGREIQTIHQQPNRSTNIRAITLGPEPRNPSR